MPEPSPNLVRRALEPARVAKAYAQGDDLKRLRIRRESLRKMIRRHTPIVVREDRGINYVIDLRDESEVTQWIWFYGRYEDPLLARATACLTLDGLGTRPLEGKTFLDVGANIGTATLCAFTRQGAARALMIEPHPDNLRLLRMNLAANDLTDSATVRAAAISDEPGEVVFEESTDNIGDHRIRTGDAEAGELDEQFRTTITVPATTLDRALADAKVKPADVGLTWVDVQGHELQVIEGAPKLLEAGVPWCIEFWPYGLERAGTLSRFVEILQQHFSHAWDLGTPPGYELVTPAAAGTRIELSDLNALAAQLPTADLSTNLLLVPRS